MNNSFFKKIAQALGKTDEVAKVSPEAKLLHERLLGMNESGKYYKPGGVQGVASVDEAQGTLEMLPIDVQNAIAKAAKGDHHVLDAIYSKYFNYGIKPNELNQLLPDSPPTQMLTHQQALKQRLKRGVVGGSAIGAAAGMNDDAYASPTAESISPLPAIESALSAYRGGLQNVSDKMANHIVSGTTPIPPGKQREEFVQDNAPIVSTGMQMFGDPANYVPGAGEAMMAHDLLKEDER